MRVNVPACIDSAAITGQCSCRFNSIVGLLIFNQVAIPPSCYTKIQPKWFGPRLGGIVDQSWGICIIHERLEFYLFASQLLDRQHLQAVPAFCLHFNQVTACRTISVETLDIYFIQYHSKPTPIILTAFILFGSHVHCIYSLNSNHTLYIFSYSFATTCFHGRHFVFLPNSKDISNISTTTTPINFACSSVTSLMHHYIHTGI